MSSWLRLKGNQANDKISEALNRTRNWTEQKQKLNQNPLNANPPAESFNYDWHAVDGDVDIDSDSGCCCWLPQLASISTRLNFFWRGLLIAAVSATVAATVRCWNSSVKRQARDNCNTISVAATSYPPPQRKKLATSPNRRDEPFHTLSATLVTVCESSDENIKL